MIIIAVPIIYIIKSIIKSHKSKNKKNITPGIFNELVKYKNIYQYQNMKKNQIVEDDIDNYIKNGIMLGPNNIKIMDLNTVIANIVIIIDY